MLVSLSLISRESRVLQHRDSPSRLRAVCICLIQPCAVVDSKMQTHSNAFTANTNEMADYDDEDMPQKTRGCRVDIAESANVG